MWKPGCNFDYIVGTFVHVELKFSAQFSLSPRCVNCFVLGLLGTHAEASQRTLQRFNNSPEFLQYNSPICTLNLELLYGRTLIESNSYHHHHHNGHEICFVLLSRAEWKILKLEFAKVWGRFWTTSQHWFQNSFRNHDRTIRLVLN